MEKLDFNEAQEFLEAYKTVKKYDHDHVDKLVALKKLMSKYVANLSIMLDTGYEMIWVMEYPEDGMEEADVKELSELGFILDEDSIAMFA
jgi:hypothetical protein